MHVGMYIHIWCIYVLCRFHLTHVAADLSKFTLISMSIVMYVLCRMYSRCAHKQCICECSYSFMYNVECNQLVVASPTDDVFSRILYSCMYNVEYNQIIFAALMSDVFSYIYIYIYIYSCMYNIACIHIITAATMNKGTCVRDVYVLYAWRITCYTSYYAHMTEYLSLW